MRAYKLTGCRAGNDELEDAERHEDLGTSQLLEADQELSQKAFNWWKTGMKAARACLSSNTGYAMDLKKRPNRELRNKWGPLSNELCFQDEEKTTKVRFSGCKQEYV